MSGEQILIAVSGANVYSVNTSMVATLIGTLASVSGQVSISDNITTNNVNSNQSSRNQYDATQHQHHTDNFHKNYNNAATVNKAEQVNTQQPEVSTVKKGRNNNHNNDGCTTHQ
jgi:hypothetical protein